MTENKGHIHAANSELYTKDMYETDKPWERWQYREPRGAFYPENQWGQCLERDMTWNPMFEYRRKPITKKYILELPEPLREEPKQDERYWTINDGFEAILLKWNGFDYEQIRLKIGFCFATKTDAQAFIDAIKNRQPATE